MVPDAEVWNAACRTVQTVPQFSEAPVRVTTLRLRCQFGREVAVTSP